MMFHRPICVASLVLPLFCGLYSVAEDASQSEGGVTVWSILGARPVAGVQLVDANRDMQDALARIGDSIRTQRLDEAVDGLQGLINADRPVLFPRWDNPRRYIPSSEVATRMLGLLPREAVARASRQSEGAARRSYEEARADVREDLLLRTGRRYFHTPSGAEALNTLASLAFDRGACIEASYLWETLYFEQRGSALDRPLVLAKAVLAAHMGGWKGKASDLLSVLAASHPSATAVIAGREQNVLAFVRRSVAGAVPPLAVPPPAARWELPSGAASGYAVMQDCAVSPLPLWPQQEREAAANIAAMLRLGEGAAEPGQTRVDAGMSAGRVRVTVRRPGEPEFAYDLQAMVHPLVLGDRVVCRREDGVAAVAVETGRELWRTPYPMSRGGSAGRTANHYLPLGGDVGRYTASAGDGLVFAVGRFRRIDPDAYSKFGDTLEIDRSSVCAMAVADGKPAWEVGNGKGDDDVIRNAKFLTAPTFHGGRLHVLAKVGNRYHAICLDAKTGRRVWDVPVGPIPTHSGEQMSWQAAYTMEIMTERATPPAVSDGVVYILTNAGLVMALDAMTGAPLWAYRYESRVSTTADIGRSFEVANMAFLIAASRRPFPPHNPVLVVRGRVIVAPSDADSVLALHALSGENLWQTRREGRRDLSAVDDGRFLLSGPDMLFLSVNDGAIVKQVDVAVEDRPAVTRSAVVASGHGALVRVDLSDYAVSAQATGDDLAILGRLVSAGGRLVAANAAGVSVYLGYSDAMETLSRRLSGAAAPAQRVEWLGQRGMLAMYSNRTSEAVADFRAAAEAARPLPPERAKKVQPLLVKALLRLAEESETEEAATRCLSEADASCGEAGRDAVQQAKMRALERFGRFDKAVALAQSAAETDASRWMPLRRGDRDADPVWVTGRVWGNSEAGRIIRERGQSAYAQFDARFDEVIDQLRGDGDAEALLAAQRRWPNAARTGKALYRAAEALWRRGGGSPDAAAAARVDRILGAIAPSSGEGAMAGAAQALIDSRFRPGLLSEARIASLGLSTNAAVSFGGSSETVPDMLARAKLEASRMPASHASFAGVTGVLEFAWSVEGRNVSVLRSSDGRPLLADDRRLCIRDGDSVQCLNIQLPGGPATLWRVDVPQATGTGWRLGHHFAGQDLLALLTPEVVVVVEAQSGREVARKSTRELGVYPWSMAAGDGPRVMFANERQDWVAAVDIRNLTRAWSARAGGMDEGGLEAATDICVVSRRGRSPYVSMLDSRSGRQVLYFSSWTLQARVNEDAFCAVMDRERGGGVEFHDPRRPAQSLVARAAVTNGVYDLVAFGPRHAVLQERGNRAVLRFVDAAGETPVAEARLLPPDMTNMAVLGVAWGADAAFIASGVSGGRPGLVSGLTVSAVDPRSGAVRWSLGAGTDRDGQYRLGGLCRYGSNLGIMVVPHGDGSQARHIVVDCVGGRVVCDLADPFGRPVKGGLWTPEWAGAPVVMNGLVVFESTLGLVCFAEPLR
jgi:outer membrane protein assembly factor BamB